jgi:hypothetical protein
VYNYGIEAKSPALKPGTYVDAYRKINGFMVAVTWHDNDLLISTTGSTDSEYVTMAKELIQPNLEKFRKTCKDYSCYTFMFEAVHKNDPHIILEQEGLYLLGLRSKLLGSPMSVSNALADNFGCFGVEHVHCTIETLQLLARHVQHEGFVFYTEDGLSAKIKSPYYLVQKALARKKDILSLNKQNVDEEYFDLLDHLVSIKEQFNSLSEQDRLIYMRNFLEKSL